MTKAIFWKGGKICLLCNKKKYVFFWNSCKECCIKAEKILRKRVRQEKKVEDKSPYIAKPTPEDLTTIKLLVIKYKRRLLCEGDPLRIVDMFVKYRRKSIKKSYDGFTPIVQISKMVKDLLSVYQYYKVD